MTDTNIALAPATAHTSGSMTITASAALFSADDVGRAIAILHKCDTTRAANTAYAAGKIFVSEYNQVPRLYRVIGAGTTAAASMAGTTPNYDLAAPNETGPAVLDGSAVLKYLGPGRHAWGFGIITAYTDSTHVTVAVDPRGPFANTYASLRWRLGEFCDARGWPIAGTFHRGRLWLGGSDARPHTLWASQTGDFETFAPNEPDGTVLDTNAIAVSLDADEVERVRWLLSAPRGLLVGTASGEWLVAPANRNAAMSPANIGAERQGDRGTDAAGPVARVGGFALFPQRGGRRLREMSYDFGGDRFTSPDLCALAEDIAGEGFSEITYADVPDGTVHALRADGRVAVLTYDPEQRMRAWTLDTIGGDGTVESIAAVPDPDGTATDLYLVVRRTVDEVDRLTIEVIRSPFRAELDGAAAGYFVDCGLTYSGTAVNTVTGLDHLDGMEVAICADGAMRQTQTVSGGSVSVTGTAASTIHVGLAYRTTIIDLPPDVQAPGGSVQGLTQRLVKVTLRLHDTALAHVGGRDARTTELQFRTTRDDLGSAAALFTGDRDVTANADWDASAQVRITTTAPLPLTVLAIGREVSFGDR
jgi:hypothetical protein